MAKQLEFEFMNEPEEQYGKYQFSIKNILKLQTSMAIGIGSVGFTASQVVEDYSDIGLKEGTQIAVMALPLIMLSYGVLHLTKSSFEIVYNQLTNN